MKRLLTLVAFFATLEASAQQVNPVPDYVFANRMSAGRNTVTDTAAYFSIGPRYGATRGMMPPMVVDTASFSGNRRNGLLIFSVQKNKFLYWDSVRVQWSDMAGSSGSYITGTLTTNYIPKATGSTTLGNSVMYDSSGHVRVYGNYVGNTNPNRLLFTSEISGNNGYTALFKQSDSITDAGQFPLILRKGLLTTDKPRPNFGVGLETQLQDDAGTWKRSGFIVNRIVDSTAANFRTKFDFRLINGSTYPIPLIVSGDSSIRMAKLAGSGTRYVVADANGDISATSATALVDTLTISTRAWRQKGLDSLAALEVSGSGTTNYIPKFTAGSTIGNSQIFDNGTNVGIGTASPLSKLQVSGETVITNGSPTSTQNGLHLFFDTNVGYITSEQPGTTFRELRVQGSPLILQTAGTERLRITSVGDVGIGTSSPNTKTEIFGGDARVALSAVTTSTFRGYQMATGTTEFASLKAEAALGELRLTSGFTGFGGFTTFHNNGSERMRIFANGRIGINTTTDAGYQLDINGTLRSVNGANFATTSGNVSIGTATASSVSTARLSILGSGVQDSYIQVMNGAGGGFLMGSLNGTGMQFYTLTGTQGSESVTKRMEINSNGEMLINTSTDAGDYKLQVSGNALFTNAFLSANTGAFVFGTNSAVNPYIQGTSGNALAFGTSNNPRMQITADGEILINTSSDAGDYKLQVSGNIYNTGSAVLAATSGNVGIGTASPSAKLTVVGAGAQTILNSGSAADARMEFHYNSGREGFISWDTDNIRLQADAGNYLTFFTNATERGRINSAGEWIIDASGTDAGDYKLQVSGNVYSTGSYTSGSPSGGTARPWKLGSVVATTVILDTANYVEVEINGVAYKLALATPN